MPRGYLKNCKNTSNKARRGGSSSLHQNKPHPKPKIVHEVVETIWNNKGWEGRKQRCARGGSRALQCQDDDFTLHFGRQSVCHSKVRASRPTHTKGHDRRCQICFENDESVVDLAGCGHYACQTCLKQQYIIQPQLDASRYIPSKRGASLICFGQGCNRAISGHQLQHARILEDNEDLNKFYKFRTLVAARARGREVVDCISCGGALLGPKLSGDVEINSTVMLRVFYSKCRTCAWAGWVFAPPSGMSWDTRNKLYQSTAEVVDLLLAITTAAATSPRVSKILNPFPLLVKSNGERILDPDQPDYNKARKIISQLPSMQQIVATNNEEDLKKICADRGQHVQSIFRWITSSCTAHLVSLSEDHRLTSMGTRFQFLSISPEQERAFAAKKKTHGSIFGFHGSPIENWHSILREGVKNCSGTSLQLHGAAYGNGVYVSPSASQSLGYSRVVRSYNQLGTTSSGASRSENKFISGEQVGILALCEIIDDNTVRKQNNIWVIPNDTHVVTRFLFVFLHSSPDFNDIYSKASQCSTTDPSFQREINAAMENIKGKRKKEKEKKEKKK